MVTFSCVETDSFPALIEIARYKNRPQCRQQVSGDGPEYIGRGMLHLTGRENYDRYGKILHKDLVNHPDSVAVDPDIAVRTACEFWVSRVVNTRADKDDLKAVTLLVNGGLNGFTQRHLALGRIKKEMGIAQ